MTHDEALRIVVPLNAEARKELLKVLCEEMNSDDLEEVIADQGYEIQAA